MAAMQPVSGICGEMKQSDDAEFNDPRLAHDGR
jgi:hypothetical protein